MKKPGNDEISSGDKNDTIFGGSGRDQIDGGAGNDILNGGSDRDDLTGGHGADVFRFYLASESTPQTYDRIRDFYASQGDKIDPTLIDANSNVGGNDNFVFVAVFTQSAGQLIATAAGSGLYWVQADVSGDGVADLQIEVKSDSPLTANDFLLQQLSGQRSAFSSQQAAISDLDGPNGRNAEVVGTLCVPSLVVVRVPGLLVWFLACSERAASRRHME